jgi:hypothetical protein
MELPAEDFRREHFPRKWVFLAAAIILSMIVDLLLLSLGWKWLLALLAAATFSILILLRWPYGALLALIATSAVPRYTVQVVSWNAKAEHLVTTVVAIVILMRVCLQHEHLNFQRNDYLLLAFVGTNYLGSAINSPNPKATLRWALLLTLASLSYFVIVHLLSRPHDSQKP